MKIRRLLLLCLAGIATLSAQTAVTPDAEFTALQELAAAHPPASSKEMGREKYLTWIDVQNQKVTVAALAFYETHPTDPRRWEAVLILTNNAPFFAKSFGPEVETKGLAAAVIDQPAKTAWTEKADALKQALLASADATPEVREPLEWNLFAKDFRATTAAMRAGKTVDWTVFRPRFDAHVSKYQNLDIGAKRAGDYLGALEHNVPGSSAKEWAHLAAITPDANLHTLAAQRATLADVMSHPLELAFTAADGRPVDVAKLRGKVVLVDFWATWCGPCKEELPNVKRVYAAYHDKGFEVVGIALENGNLSPKDTPEQAGRKREKAKKVLTDFTAENAMPWPQYFDGKFWQNDISTRYAISAIPAMFLLDQDGKVVSTNARGPMLEAEVKRLLKL